MQRVRLWSFFLAVIYLFIYLIGYYIIPLIFHGCHIPNYMSKTWWKICLIFSWQRHFVLEVHSPSWVSFSIFFIQSQYSRVAPGTVPTSPPQGQWVCPWHRKFLLRNKQMFLRKESYCLLFTGWAPQMGKSHWGWSVGTWSSGWTEGNWRTGTLTLFFSLKWSSQIINLSHSFNMIRIKIVTYAPMQRQSLFCLAEKNKKTFTSFLENLSHTVFPQTVLVKHWGLYPLRWSLHCLTSMSHLVEDMAWPYILFELWCLCGPCYCGIWAALSLSCIYPHNPTMV